MAIPHAVPGQVVNLHSTPDDPHFGMTTTLVKTPEVEVIRLVMQSGKEIPPHRARGPITVQGLEGRVVFQARGQTHELTPGQLLYLEANDEHSLKALEPSAVLVTLRL